MRNFDAAEPLNPAILPPNQLLHKTTVEEISLIIESLTFSALKG